MITKNILASLVVCGILLVFGNAQAIVQIIEADPAGQSADTPYRSWQNSGLGYYMLKDLNGQYFTGVTEATKTSCISLNYSYKDVPFLLDLYKKNNPEISRMDLTFDKKVEVENAMGLKISQLHLLVGGNIGNVYAKTNTYVYSDDINLVFKYSDGSQFEISARMDWNWSQGTDLKGTGYKRIYIGQNPCDPRAALYAIDFINPYPDKEVVSFTIDDDFIDSYPYTEIMALTVNTNEIVEGDDAYMQSPEPVYTPFLSSPSPAWKPVPLRGDEDEGERPVSGFDEWLKLVFSGSNTPLSVFAVIAMMVMAFLTVIITRKL